MSGSQYLEKKSVADLQTEKTDGTALKRTLGPWRLLALGVGATIGAGIFVLTGTAAAQYAGPAIMLSFILGGIACAFAGLCYAEFAALLPIAGSAYTYSYATLGELVAWVIGWDLILEYALGTATVAVGWAGYVSSFLRDLGVSLPAPHGLLAHLNWVALLGVLGVTALLAFGVRESTSLNAAIVAVKLCVIALFLAFGVGHVHPVNWHPFVPPNTGHFGHFGWSGVLRGAGVIFFAYIGFDAVSTAAQEAKNPQRDMPIGILGSLALCTVLYIAVSAVLTGLVPYPRLNVAAPIAVGVAATGLPWLTLVVKIGIIAGLTSVMLVLLYGQSRIFFTMAGDGLLPAVFSRLHPRFQTPVYATWLLGGIVALVAAFVPLTLLCEQVSIGTLFAFILVCAGVLYLRWTKPNLPRPFGVPACRLFQFVPITGILACLYLISSLPLETMLRFVVWLLISFIVYFGYIRHHGKLSKAKD